MEEVLRRLDKLESNMGQKVDNLGERVGELSGIVRENRAVMDGEVRRLEQRVDMHAINQSAEHASVKTEVDQINRDVTGLKTAAAVNTAKLGMFGAGAGLVVSVAWQALRGLFTNGQS